MAKTVGLANQLLYQMFPTWYFSAVPAQASITAQDLCFHSQPHSPINTHPSQATVNIPPPPLFTSHLKRQLEGQSHSKVAGPDGISPRGTKGVTLQLYRLSVAGKRLSSGSWLTKLWGGVTDYKAVYMKRWWNANFTPLYVAIIHFQQSYVWKGNKTHQFFMCILLLDQ